MTPGLAFFYGGLVSRRNVLGIMIQSYVSMGWTTVLWFVVGYSLCFSGGKGGIIGDLNLAFLNGVTLDTPSTLNATIPAFVFIAYQMMFAIITPALITGAFANRVTFKAYMLFLTGWLLFVYFPFVHMIWGGGFLAANGVLDFAGGIVVHAIAGFAALASVLYVGRRRTPDGGAHSIPLVALGTGLLWFGWYGFNAGSEFRVDAVTAVAFLNTDLAASFAGIVWLAIEWRATGQPRFLGLLTGSVAGLASITPAAGYVAPVTAVIIGCAAGVVCYLAVALKNRLHLDDALDVWGVHGVGGTLGIVMLGLFATKAFNPAGVDGLLNGNPGFFFAEVGAVLLAIVWALAFTVAMLWLINRVTPVRVDAAAHLADHLAVHAHPALGDQLLRGSPRGHSCLGQHLLQPDALRRLRRSVTGRHAKSEKSSIESTSGSRGASGGRSARVDSPSRSRKSSVVRNRMACVCGSVPASSTRARAFRSRKPRLKAVMASSLNWRAS
jgi:Amt family ammonium transporter